MIKNIFVAAAIGAVAFGAQAAPLIANGSLSGTTADYVYNGVAPSIAAAYPGFGSTPGTVADWNGSFVSIASNSGAWGNPSSLSGGAHGLLGWVTGIQADGTLSQSLNLAAGTYSLTWIDANRGNDQNYVVSFDGGSVSYADPTSFATTGGQGWKTEHLLFTTTGGTGSLTFSGGTIWGQSDSTSFIDNVQLSAVPEPTSLMLMALGTLGLLAWRRRAQV